MKQSKRILSVTVKRMIDDSPDTSWLGEYSNKPANGFAIDREHAEDCPLFWFGEQYGEKECSCEGHGDRLSRELQYFNPPSENYKGENILDVREYCLQDYKRMESYNRQNWCFLGVRAEAEVQAETDGAIQTLTSGGLWGIESDSEKSYIEDEENNQLAELRGVLKAFGFSSRAISKAFQNIEHKDA